MDVPRKVSKQKYNFSGRKRNTGKEEFILMQIIYQGGPWKQLQTLPENWVPMKTIKVQSEDHWNDETKQLEDHDINELVKWKEKDVKSKLEIYYRSHKVKFASWKWNIKKSRGNGWFCCLAEGLTIEQSAVGLGEVIWWNVWWSLGYVKMVENVQQWFYWVKSQVDMCVDVIICVLQVKISTQSNCEMWQYYVGALFERIVACHISYVQWLFYWVFDVASCGTSKAVIVVEQLVCKVS